MFVPAGSSIFFLREHRFAVRCRVVTLRQLLWTLFTLLFMLSYLSMCLLHIFLYIFFINIGCATLYHLSMMYVTVYDMSFNSNCRILAAKLNYRFTKIFFCEISDFPQTLKATTKKNLWTFFWLFAFDSQIVLVYCL